MKRLLMTVLILGLAAPVRPTQADEVRAKKQEPAAAKQTELKQAYLGLGIESVSPTLSSQLPDLLAKGQGVLIDQVTKDSPAAKAGLQPYDILLSYGDHKLHSS